MLDLLFVLFLLMFVIFLIISIEAERHGDYFWAMVCAFLCIGITLVLSVTVMEIHQPYEMYNASSGTIETGYHNYTQLPWLSYFFQGIAIIMGIYVALMVFEPIIHVFEKMRRWR